MVAAPGLAAKHRHLVTEHDDLYRQLVVVTSEEPEELEDPDESQVEERQCHS